MFTSGLTNTPITKTLLIYILASSILLSILDLKHLAGIQVSPHFWTYGQFWRAALWHVAGFANSTEALFAGILVYQVRVVERAWGGEESCRMFSIHLPPFPIDAFFLEIKLTQKKVLPRFNITVYNPSSPDTPRALHPSYHPNHNQLSPLGSNSGDIRPSRAVPCFNPAYLSLSPSHHHHHHHLSIR